MHHPTDRIAHTTAFVTPVVEHSQQKKKHTTAISWTTLFQLAARDYLYVPSHSQDSTYHSFWYTSGGALAGMRNSPMGPP